jgi:hypothetical protein
MRARNWTGIIAWALLIGTIQGQTNSPPADRATRSGQTITLHPSEATFTVPAEWIFWYKKFHNNLHLTATQLDSVRIPLGVWDTEFAMVVNSVLPFQDCVAHVGGGHGWGKDGSSFGDVQLRVYVTPFSEEQVKVSVSAQGLSAAQKFSSQASLLPTVTVDAWHRTSLKYELFYYDDGETARVDFFTTTYENQTLVLVFTYCDTNRFGAGSEVASILSSFRFPTKKPK